MGENFINCDYLNDNDKIILSLTKITQSKSYSGKKKKKRSYYWRLTCHEQFENSSRLGVQNNRDPDSHVCIVQSDRFVSKYLMGAWLQCVSTRARQRFKETFYYQSFLYPWKSSFPSLPTGKQTMCRLSGKEVELKLRLANQTRRQVER